MVPFLTRIVSSKMCNAGVQYIFLSLLTNLSPVKNGDHIIAKRCTWVTEIRDLISWRNRSLASVSSTSGMEVVSGVGVNAITGLGVWTARTLFNRYEENKLNKTRLGHWHKLIFEKNRITDIRTSKKAKIPVIRGSEELKNISANSTRSNIELGAVCWRGLMGMYANEEDIINHFKKEDCFRRYSEVGAYREHVAAVINVKDLYSYIFKNLSPSSWARVTLNKQERVSTNIGEFSMLYYSNMKWFHFVPIASVTSLDAYENEFNRLRNTGHSIEGIEGSELMKIVFKTGSSRPWQVEVELPLGPLPDRTSHAVRQYITQKNGPLAGGAVLPEREEDVVSFYSNFISYLVWSVVFEYLPNGFHKEENFRHHHKSLWEQLDKIDRATWAATRVKELIPAVNAAVEILFFMGQKFMRYGEMIAFCTSSAKILGGLVDRIFVLGWTIEEWNSLDQLAWLAGIADGTGGEDNEEIDFETEEYPDSSDESRSVTNDIHI